MIPIKEGENGHVRTVCRLGNLPANNVANILTKLLKTEGESVAEPVKTKVVIVPDVTVNCLFLSGPPAAVEEVRRLVSEIDRPASMIRLEVQLTQEKEPLMQAELYTLDNQKAYIQFGRQEPRITGATFSNSGAYNIFTHEKVGSAITITPRVSSEGRVAVLIDIQDSRLGPQEEGAIVVTPKDGPPIRTPNTENLTYQTTLQLQDGQTQTISAMTRNGKTRQIAITAHIIRPGAANPAAQK